MSSKAVSTTQTTICKVCFDVGKSEEEYTNHRVRDINGVVVCPTLLQVHCRYCDMVGHTVKYCSLRERDEKKREMFDARAIYQAKIKDKTKSNGATAATAIQKSIYAVLQSDSSDDESSGFEKVRAKKLKYKKPVLILTDATDAKAAPATATATAPLTGWAAIAVKPPAANAKAKAKANATAEAKTVAQIPNHARKVPQSVRKAMRSWADCSDTDSESEGK